MPLTYEEHADGIAEAAPHTGALRSLRPAIACEQLLMQADEELIIDVTNLLAHPDCKSFESRNHTSIASEPYSGFPH